MLHIYIRYTVLQSPSLARRSLTHSLTRHQLARHQLARPLITTTPIPEDNRRPNPSLFGSLRAHTVQPGARRVSAARAPDRVLPLIAVWDQGSFFCCDQKDHMPLLVTLHAYDRSGTAVQTNNLMGLQKYLKNETKKGDQKFFFF